MRNDRIYFEPDGKKRDIVVSSMGRNVNDQFFWIKQSFNFTSFLSILSFLLFYTCMEPLFKNGYREKSIQGEIHSISLTLFIT